ncbi:hypothetical protein CEXT_41561 [Caerostris extrusa]|uniref:Uncharacterized protein n=1 Tax=Caerostris extrusa TaxID=172846 RepID=A0AAV4RPR7_CAEEX|nr:hypothetical protein CEXT_41561 [Caerostris extrusa]
MDIAQDTSTGTPTTIFPEITETVVDISIRSALHYLQYKEILLAADDILTQSIPAELHTACLTFGQLQSLRRACQNLHHCSRHSIIAYSPCTNRSKSHRRRTPDAGQDKTVSHRSPD